MATTVGTASDAPRSSFQRLIRPRAWTLTARIVVLCVAIGVGSITLVSSLIYEQLSSTLMAEGTNHLEAILQNRKGVVETHLVKATNGQLKTTAESLTVADAAVAFTEGWGALESEIPDQMDNFDDAVRAYYDSEFRPRLEDGGVEWAGTSSMVPTDPTGTVLQGLYIATNPQDVG